MNGLKIIVAAFIILLTGGTCWGQTEEEFAKFAQSGQVETKNFVVKIPIEIWNNLITLKVKVNGQELRFMWDNGFSISGIDEYWVKQLKMIPFGDPNNSIALVDGNNAQVNLDYLYAQKLEIGSVSILQSPFLHFETRSITQSKDLKIDGVLGSSIINKLNWNFNFDAGFVEVSDQPFDTKATDEVIPFAIIPTNLHFMAIKFNGNETFCQVDFGANSPDIEIYRDNAVFFKNAKASKIMGQNSISVGGMAPIDTMYTIRDTYTWQLGEKDFNFKPKINFAKSNNGVVIGNRLFRERYNLIINTGDQKVYVLTNRKKTELEFIDKAYGYFMLVQDGRFKVIQIAPNDNTQKHTLKLGDEVVLINDKKPSDFIDNYALIKYQKDLLNSNKSLKLTLPNKKTIKLQAVPYTLFPYKNDKELW